MLYEGVKDSIDDLEDCLSQLYGSVIKYQTRHSFSLWEYFIEKLNEAKVSGRLQSLKMFLTDGSFSTKPTGKMSIGRSETDISTIDYIFCST